ncbi:MAG TPA: Na+/H+ antiporter NhaA [Pseudomonadales bacterium]|nr:Na+/H+ antiporter NhaA [Pseudomonadales bacterium]
MADDQQQDTPRHNKPPNTAPWEQAFERMLTLLEDFVHQQTSSSILLMICTVTAMLIANSGWNEYYFHFLHTPTAISVGKYRFEFSLLHWINEALMSFFFLLVGLELKRELLVGELADIRRAALPIIAAIGGMVIPAALYWWWNPQGIGTAGWGIPMATDIAFAIGILSLLSGRIPPTLATFLIALAIVDDLGAVMVIAFFYTEQLNFTALLIASSFTVLLMTFNLGGIQRVLPYMLVGILLWCAMLSSGVHATLAGVILAFTIPIRLKNLEPAQAPAQRLESNLHIVVAYLIIPLFALANAAIPVDINNISNIITDRVTAGVISGLVIGKWIGVAGASWLAIKTGIATMPTGLTMRHIHGIGLLAGIGFTMSIFVADLAFTGEPSVLLMAKTGILMASVISGVCGYCWLRFYCSNR